jgi:hypothetical protein
VYRDALSLPGVMEVTVEIVKENVGQEKVEVKKAMEEG